MLTNVGRRLRRPLVRPLSRFSTSVAEPGASYAHVTRTSSLTPTVRLLELRVAEKQVPQQFVPGQWIDLFIPDQPTVGGYSICSVPSELPLIRLAVKKSNYPPTKWCYNQAAVGDEVQVRVGGTFGLSAAGPTGSWHAPSASSLSSSLPAPASSPSPSEAEITTTTTTSTTAARTVAFAASSSTEAANSPAATAAATAAAAPVAPAIAQKRTAKRTVFAAHEQCKRLVLVAGGIGITPLYSIFTHLGRLVGNGDGCEDGAETLPWRPEEVHLLYGARSCSELAFGPELTALAQRYAPRLRITFVVPDADLKHDSGASTAIESGPVGSKEEMGSRGDPHSWLSSSFISGVSWTRGDKLSAEIVAKVVNEHHSSSGNERKFDSLVDEKAPLLPPPVCLLCGPPGMVDAVEAACWKAGVPPENVIYERWW